MQHEASERQERRRVQLALAENALRIVTGLIQVTLVDPNRSPEEREGLNAELKALVGPLQRYFSPTAIEKIRRFEIEQRPIVDASQKLTFLDRGHALIEALYAEIF
jgi:hypothetical protein